MIVVDFARIDDKSGIQRVVKRLVQEFLSISTSEEIMLICIKSNTLFECELAEDRVLLTDKTFNFLPGDILFLLDSSWEFIDEFIPHITHLRKIGGKIVAIVYDLIPINFPQYCSDAIVSIFNNWLEKTIPLTDKIVCISESTASDLKKYLITRDYSLEQFAINSFHLGSDIPNKEINIKPPEFLNDDIPTFLMVGTIEPRKGHRLVFETFKMLWSECIKVRLLLIGKMGWKMEEFEQEIGLYPKEKVIWLNKADDNMLITSYKYSRALIMASEIEGFGLPIIEARHHKLDVLASDIPVFREIGDELTVFFDRDKNNLASAIKAIIQQTKQESITQNKIRLWKDAAKEYYEFIKL